MGKTDAVVIGAGLGGLSAAASLAVQGKRVRVLERHNIPGGYATSFVRGRFEFEVAMHVLSGIGTGRRDAGLGAYFHELGVLDRLEFHPLKEFYRSVFPDLELLVPLEREAFIQTLVDRFPEEAEGIRGFLKLVLQLHDELRLLLAQGPQVNPMKVITECPTMLRYLTTSTQAMLDRYLRSPQLKSVVAQTWSYYALPPSRLSFFMFSMGLGSYLTMGLSYIRGRSQAMASVLADRIEELGGEVSYNNGARRIAVSSGRVRGVFTDDGEFIETDLVVANSDLTTTCRELIGEYNLPRGWLDRMGNNQIAAGTFNIYLGLDKSPDELGITSHETFFSSSHDTDEVFEEYHSPTDVGTNYLLACYNHVWEGISPPGTSLVTITLGKFGEPWARMEPEAYFDAKALVAEKLLTLVERDFPGLRDAAEVVEVSTPMTNMRYAGTLWGSFMGFDNRSISHTLFRPGNRGPVQGLYLAGAWTQPGGGMETALISGQTAAAMALSDRKGK